MKKLRNFAGFSILKLSLLFIPAMFLSLMASAGMRGTYTIDNSGTGKPDFKSFRAAAKALVDSGITGPVLFKVADGKYNETVIVGSFKGASLLNTVTFQSGSLDSSKVILDSTAIGSGKSTYGFTLGVFNANYVSFRKMTISNSATTLANAIEIGGRCNYITFENNIVSANNASGNTGSCIYDTTSIDNYISIRNNHLMGGATGLALYGDISAKKPVNEKGLIIENNLIDGQSSTGLMLQSMDSIQVSKNTIISPFIGLYFYNNSLTKDTLLISNNFIVSTSNSAVFMTNVSKANFSFNSVLTYGPNAYNYAFYLSNNAALPAVNAINNVLVNKGGGPAVFATLGALKTSDYNDFYTSGPTLGTVKNYSTGASTQCANLAKWQSGIGLDKNSLSADPMFKSASTYDLHLSAASTTVLHKGIPLPYVTDDVDGEKRGPRPNIGADETNKYFNDAGTLTIDSPAAGFCAGKRDIYGRFINSGMDTLKSMTINWSVNGIARTAISWTGMLAPSANIQLKLDTLSFFNGMRLTVKIWTSMPNGGVDSNATNDTAVSVLSPALNGTYTIGGTSPDFPSFRAAANRLNTYGVCGKVVFNVRDGIYYETVLLKVIPGASAANTITFQSQSLDSNKVTLDTAWSSSTVASGYYVVRFEGSKYVTFRKMTISNFDTMHYWNNVIELAKNASHITIESNLIFEGSVSAWGKLIWSDPNTLESHNTIRYNRICGGYRGIEFDAPIGNTIGVEVSNVIEGNYIDSSNGVGIYALYQDSMVIAGNRIFNYAYQGVGITMYGFTGNYPTMVYNNFISMMGLATYGVYCQNNSWINFSYNSIYSIRSNIYNAWFGAGSAAKTTVTNNVFFADGNGFAIHCDKLAVSNMDYNDIYYGGSGLIGVWVGTTTRTLADWQKASGMDKHSISSDPLFVKSIIGDLHISIPSPCRKVATPLSSIKRDIDGMLRNTSTPDIGADETKMDSNDLAVNAILNPIDMMCGTPITQVSVKIANWGFYDQTTFNVNLIINGKKTVQAFSGKLRGFTGKKPYDTIVNFNFSPAWNTIAGGHYDIKVYTDLVNDSNHTNDTIAVSDSIQAVPTANFKIKNTIVCKAVPFIVTDMSTGSSGAGYEYYLTDTKGKHLDSSIAQNPNTLRYNKPGNYRILQNVFNSSCNDTISFPVQISPGPNAKFGYSNACLGTTTQFIDSSAGPAAITSWSWDFGNNKTATIGKPSTVYSKSGKYIAILTITDAVGCQDSISHNIVIDSLNASFTRTATSNISTFDFKAMDTTLNTYAWNFGDSTKGSGYANTHKYLANRFYTVTLKVTNNAGCSASAKDTFTLFMTKIGVTVQNPFNLDIYPNPFSDLTNISYTLASAEKVSISLIDITGREQIISEASNQEAGAHIYNLSAGKYNLKPGIYFVKIMGGDKIIVRQIIH